MKKKNAFIYNNVCFSMVAMFQMSLIYAGRENARSPSLNNLYIIIIKYCIVLMVNNIYTVCLKIICNIYMSTLVVIHQYYMITNEPMFISNSCCIVLQPIVL